MGKWLFIFGAVIAAAALGFIYMTVCVGRFGGIKKLSRGKRAAGFFISLGAVFAVFALLAVLISVVNAVIVLLHEVLFFMLFGLGVRIAKRLRKKEFKYNWQGWLALPVSAVYLAVGWYLCHSVVQTDYSLTTDKDVGSIKAALIADSHIGVTFDGEGFAEHLKTIEAQSPDLLLIAGDFVDDGTSSEDLKRACRALGEMKLRYGVWYCYGNHDQGYYRHKDYTAEELENELRSCGVHVLKDEYELVDDRFYIIGRKDGSREERLEMDELLKGLDTDKYMIVLDHQPSDYDSEAASPADLIVSGHTHGGQLLPVTFAGEWLKMNDKTYGHEKRNGTDFIVTSGISDWEIKFKTGTRSEYVIININ